MDSLGHFASLFQGGDQAHGRWDATKNKGWTEKSAPTLADYKQHIAGIVGLGIVPVQTNGMCRFAAIDVDIDTIDHKQLLMRVKQRHLPISVCRSKSGGAHLYMFMPEPGLPATAIRQVLQRWAGLLGYPQSEIFPKQVKSSSENTGNWINLPYFGGDGTTRYAVGPDGALSLDEFLGSVEFYDSATISVDEKPDDKNAELPPCLASLTQQGVHEGQRNGTFFNLAIFYRKSQPSVWETAVMAHNSQYFQPPLDYREAKGVIESVGRSKYQYTCSESPIRDFCDREACMKLPFGVGHKPWDEAGSYDDVIAKRLRKLLTDPPKYLVEVNGLDIALSWDDFFKVQNFKSKIGQELNLIMRGVKQPQWEQTVKELLASKEDIAAPEDASMMGLVIDRFHEFLTLRERAQQKEDLLRGLPVQDGQLVLFRVGDLRRFLQGHKLDKVEGSDLFLALRQDGCFHKRVRLSGRMITVWAYPLERVNEQTLEYAVHDFKKDLEEDM